MHQAPLFLMALTSCQSHSQNSCCLLNTDSLISLWKMWRWLLIYISIIFDFFWFWIYFFHLRGLLTIGSTDTSCFPFLILSIVLPGGNFSASNKAGSKWSCKRYIQLTIWLKIWLGSRSPGGCQVKCNRECVIWLNEISRFLLLTTTPHLRAARVLGNYVGQQRNQMITAEVLSGSVPASQLSTFLFHLKLLC